MQQKNLAGCPMPWECRSPSANASSRAPGPPPGRPCDTRGLERHLRRARDPVAVRQRSTRHAQSLFRRFGETDPAHVVCSAGRSEEHTSELQSQSNLVCRLLLEKKKTYKEPIRAPTRDPEYQSGPRRASPTPGLSSESLNHLPP